MRTLAIAQSKGGTGKTTIALTLLAAAAEAGQRALLVDADHHSAGSTVLIGFTPPERSLYAVLRAVARGEAPVRGKSVSPPPDEEPGSGSP